VCVFDTGCQTVSLCHKSLPIGCKDFRIHTEFQAPVPQTKVYSDACNMWGAAIHVITYEQSENVGLIQLVSEVEKNLRLQESEFSISNACGYKMVGQEEMKCSCFQPRGVLKNTQHST